MVSPTLGSRTAEDQNRTEQSVADAVCVCVSVCVCGPIMCVVCPVVAGARLGTAIDWSRRRHCSRCPLHAASDSAERRGIDGWAGWRGTVT